MASMVMNRTWTISTSTREKREQPLAVTIICPIDFTERGVVALRYAVDMARRRRGKLVVVHVVPSAESVQELDSAGETRYETALTRLEHFVPSQPGVRCEWVVLQGEVADQLVELTASCESPHIIMATRGVTRGRKGGRGAYVGQLAEELLRRAPCPVVMVNDEDISTRRRFANRACEADHVASSTP